MHVKGYLLHHMLALSVERHPDENNRPVEGVTPASKNNGSGNSLLSWCPCNLEQFHHSVLIAYIGYY